MVKRTRGAPQQAHENCGTNVSSTTGRATLLAGSESLSTPFVSSPSPRQLLRSNPSLGQPCVLVSRGWTEGSRVFLLTELKSFRQVFFSRCWSVVRDKGAAGQHVQRG